MSILFGALAGFAQWISITEYRWESGGTTRASADAAIQAEFQWSNERCWSPPQRLKAEWSYDEYRIEGYSCLRKHELPLVPLAALLPALIMAIIGLTIRWIYRGFRQKSA